MRSRSPITLYFFAIALLITLFHFLFHPVRVLGMDTSIFYMDEKVTLAAFFTTVVSFLVGFVAVTSLAVKTKRVDKLLRLSFGIFFFLLAADEYFEIHEYLNTTLKSMLSQETVAGGLIYYSWIFQFLLVIIAVFALFGLLIKQESNAARIWLVLGIASYAVVLATELVGGSTFGNPMYVTFVGIEEGLEMISSVVFLHYALGSAHQKTKS